MSPENKANGRRRIGTYRNIFRETKKQTSPTELPMYFY